MSKQESNLENRNGKLRAFLELIRPPALLTASADSITGWAWASSFGLITLGHQHEIESVILWVTPIILMIASTMIYAAGMATNDLFDYQEDLKDRPFRPIPSGRISVRAAWRFAIGLQVSALLLLSLALPYLWGNDATWTLFFAGLTILMTYLYNRVFKNSLVAPFFMGLCRWANFWIGASLIFSIHGTLIQSHPLIHFNLPTYTSLGTLFYVTALTGLSRFETSGGIGSRIWAIFLLLLSTHPLWWHILGLTPSHSYPHLFILYFSTVLSLLWLWQKLKHTLSATPSATQIQQGVSAGIRGVALTNMCLCFAFGVWPLALLILILSLSAGKVARWFYAT